MPSCRSGITLEFFLNDHGDIDDEQAGQYCESYACAIPKDDVGCFDRSGVTCCFWVFSQECHAAFMHFVVDGLSLVHCLLSATSYIGIRDLTNTQRLYKCWWDAQQRQSGDERRHGQVCVVARRVLDGSNTGASKPSADGRISLCRQSMRTTMVRVPYVCGQN